MASDAFLEICSFGPQGPELRWLGWMRSLERGISTVHANDAVAGEEAYAVLGAVASDTAGTPETLA
ncbi:hypothetical protein D3C73_1330100 [compost metagenome]